MRGFSFGLLFVRYFAHPERDLLHYSVLRASTGSFLAAEREGIMPAIRVSTTLIATRMIDNDELPHCDEAQNKNRVIYRRFPSVSKFVLVVGVCSLLFVPVFKTLTGLPPFMGIIISLGFANAVRYACSR